MKFNRLTFGIVAAVLALAMEAGGGRMRAKALLLICAGVAGAVMWIGESSGLMREALQPSAEPVLGLDKRRSS